MHDRFYEVAVGKQTTVSACFHNRKLKGRSEKIFKKNLYKLLIVANYLEYFL